MSSPPTDRTSATGGSALLEARDLVKSYSRGNEIVHALQHVDLVLEPHRLIGLVGRSGSGKTTLLNILAGWERQDQGRLDWTVEPSSRTLTCWADISVLPQKLGLIEELTVQENIEYPARLAGRLDEMTAELERLVASLGLQELLERFPLETSVGEQQRTALARAARVDASFALGRRTHRSPGQPQRGQGLPGASSRGRAWNLLSRCDAQRGSRGLSG